jgi:predicted nucleotidyltransferase
MPSPSVATIKQTLRQHLPALREEYGVASFALFGSYVRGDEGPDSDIDVLVTFDDPPGLLGFVALENKLSDLLDHPVDLVVRESLKPQIGARVEKEAEPI